jgi:catechol 2,3-dioxygenase-like lactoylglutathione lyase family enzyme
MAAQVFIDHLTLPVRDFEASKRFYRRALAPFGVEEVEQPPRRRQPEERRDAKPLSRRAVVLGGADRVGADKRPLLRVPERDLMPPAAPQERQDLERRPCRGLLGKFVVWDAKLFGDGAAVTAVPVEQLHNAGRTPSSRARPSAVSSATGSIIQTRPCNATACEVRCIKRGSGAIQPYAKPSSSTKRTPLTPPTVLAGAS